eukprot:COSAG01_NODE_16617_length_1220_cov_2.398029_1_plen_64_part_10
MHGTPTGAHLTWLELPAIVLAVGPGGGGQLAYFGFGHLCGIFAGFFWALLQGIGDVSRVFNGQR